MTEKIAELKALLLGATREQQMEVLFEKDRPFGKKVMDLVRELSASGVIVGEIGDFKFHPIASKGLLSHIVGSNIPELAKQLKSVQRTRWAEEHKRHFEEVLDFPDGFKAASEAFDYMRGHYPTLSAFAEVSTIYMKLFKRLRYKHPEEYQLGEAGVRVDLQRNKAAIKAARRFIS